MQYYTRKQYMNNEIDHTSYYAQFITPHTIGFVKKHFPIEKLIKSKCEHFNDLVRMERDTWIWDQTPINVELYNDLEYPHNKGTGKRVLPSQASRTCVGKACARIILDKYKKENNLE